MSERMLLKGMLAERKMKYREAKTLADGYIIAIRSALNPYAEIEDLNLPQVSAQVAELYKAWEKCRQLKEEIQRMEKDLNG